jgi:hypothetical protein
MRVGKQNAIHVFRGDMKWESWLPVDLNPIVEEEDGVSTG